ncbi:MAG: MoaD/ThiS family protein [Candidatus Rokubacteria bacterium]|nr:MoaD/ThiS family protein [Candidatus Rokubacteria bacterium]
MPVRVRIPTPLRTITKGAAEVSAKGTDVRELIEDLERQFPGLRERIVDEGGEIRRFINVFMNDEDIRFLKGKETSLKDGDEISIVPAIAAGAAPSDEHHEARGRSQPERT